MRTFKSYKPKRGLPKIAVQTFRTAHGKPPLKVTQPKQTTAIKIMRAPK